MGNILVTGVNGFVGHHLVTELSEHGYMVHGVGGPSNVSGSPEGLTDYVVVDLTDREAVNRLDFTGIDGIIHLAGLAAVGPSFDAPLEYLTTNAGIEVNLFEAALAQKAKPRFVIVSSGSLYDPSASLPLTEASPALPSSPYAVSKLAQEQLAQYYASRGFEVVLARPFNHIGPGQGPGFIAPDLAQQVVAVERKQADKIMVGNLDAQRDYTDVRDIAVAYRLLLEKGRTGELYNICSGTAHSGHELLEALLAASDQQPKIETDQAKLRPADNPVIYGDHQKLTTDTGWQSTISFEQTLADVLAYWRSR